MWSSRVENSRRDPSEVVGHEQNAEHHQHGPPDGLDEPEAPPSPGDDRGEPAEGQARQEERHGQPQRVREEEENAAGQRAVVLRQAEDDRQDRTDARGPGERERHPHDRGGPRPQGRRPHVEAPLTGHPGQHAPRTGTDPGPEPGGEHPQEENQAEQDHHESAHVREGLLVRDQKATDAGRRGAEGHEHHGEAGDEEADAASIGRMETGAGGGGAAVAIGGALAIGGAVATDARAVGGPAEAALDPSPSGSGGADIAGPPEGATLLLAVSSAAESPETMET